MHRMRSGILGMAVAVALSGCGGSAVDDGATGFTPTDTKPLDPMVKQMQDVMKKRDYTRKASPPPEKEKSKETKKK